MGVLDPMRLAAVLGRSASRSGEELMLPLLMDWEWDLLRGRFCSFSFLDNSSTSFDIYMIQSLDISYEDPNTLLRILCEWRIYATVLQCNSIS